MPKCQWRDKPGATETCTTLADAGKSMCPRHEFMDALKAQQKEAKADNSAQAAAAGVKGHGPLTRLAMLQAGYQFRGAKECSGCGKSIEWWSTANKKMAPYNPMPLPESFSKSHFATCTEANSFRRSA